MLCQSWNMLILCFAQPIINSWMPCTYFTKNCNSMKILFVDLTEFFISFDTIASVIASKKCVFPGQQFDGKNWHFSKNYVDNSNLFASIEIFCSFLFEKVYLSWNGVVIGKVQNHGTTSSFSKDDFIGTRCWNLRIFLPLRFYVKSK